MRQPRLYLSLTIIHENAGFYRPLLDVTVLLKLYQANIFWCYAISDQVKAIKWHAIDTINRKLYGLRRSLDDVIAAALGINKIQFVGIG